VNRSAETIKVDIGGSEYASLSCLAFENASKRNKPILEVMKRFLNVQNQFKQDLIGF